MFFYLTFPHSISLTKASTIHARREYYTMHHQTPIHMSSKGEGNNQTVKDCLHKNEPSYSAITTRVANQVMQDWVQAPPKSAVPNKKKSCLKSPSITLPNPRFLKCYKENRRVHQDYINTSTAPTTTSPKHS